jgi:hypothetical protein
MQQTEAVVDRGWDSSSTKECACRGIPSRISSLVDDAVNVALFEEIDVVVATSDKQDRQFWSTIPTTAPTTMNESKCKRLYD